MALCVSQFVLSKKICVSVRWVTLWVRPPLMCVLSLEDDFRWIHACCLLRFAAFFFVIDNQVTGYPPTNRIFFKPSLTMFVNYTLPAPLSVLSNLSTLPCQPGLFFRILISSSTTIICVNIRFSELDCIDDSKLILISIC